MGRKVVVALAAMAIAGTASAQEMNTPVVGPMRFGMSLEQIKAAAPTATWSDVGFTKHARRLTSIRGEAAVTLADTPFDLEAYDSYGTRKWTLSTVIRNSSATACDAKARAVFAALDPGLPALTSRAPTVIPGQRTTAPWNVQRLPGGGVVVTPGISSQGPATTYGETISMSAKSSALIQARDAKSRPVTAKDYGKRPPVSYTLEASTSSDQGPFITYTADFGDFLDPTACAIRLTIEVGDARPGEARAFDPAKLSAPLIGYRHWRAFRLGTIPAQGVEVPLICAVSRASGRITNCDQDQKSTPELAPYASAIERNYETASYDLGAVDKDDPLPVTIRFNGRIDASDRRPIDFLDAPRTPLKDLRWRGVTTAREWERLYSADLQDKGLQASLTFTCQIQSDYSVICGNIRAQDQDAAVAAAFEPIVLHGMTGAYAAEKKADGASSVGAVFDYAVVFKLEP